MTKFEQMYIPEPNSGCWLWIGHISANGYAKLGSGYAHRVSYESHVGPIEGGLVIDHVCRTKSCVNPHHLELVTQAENVQRGVPFWRRRPGPQALKTHCLKGHPFSGSNLYVKPNGRRVCRACAQDQRASHKLRGAVRCACGSQSKASPISTTSPK
jgi:hypothetical protein